MEYSDELIKKTIKMWQPYSKEPLTREDAREIIQNVTGFFDILARWDREQKEREKNPKAEPQSDPA